MSPVAMGINCGLMPWERDYGQIGRTPSAYIADAFGSLPRKTLDLIDTREVPPPNWSEQSLGEMLRNPSQRARNTALGTGPGSVEGIPGVAAMLPIGEGASVTGRAVARIFHALPDMVKTGIVSGAVGALANEARNAGLPDWVVHWLENAELVRQFGKHP
jgi:hypothetical protein